LVGLAYHWDHGQCANHLEELGNDVVAGAINIAGAQDEPFAAEGLDELFGAAFGLVIGALADVCAEGGKENETTDARGGGCFEDIASAFDVDFFESD
jgi:hypothetical protein